MSEKLCLFCKHFDYEGIDHIDYGGMTGGNMTGGLNCLKGHYDEEIPSDLNNFRELLLRAATCPDYEQVKAWQPESAPLPRP